MLLSVSEPFPPSPYTRGPPGACHACSLRVPGLCCGVQAALGEELCSHALLKGLRLMRQFIFLRIPFPVWCLGWIVDLP